MKTILTILFMLVSISAYSTERHHEQGPKGDTGAPGRDAQDTVNNYSVTNNYSTKGIAASMALSGASYDWSSEALQWSVSGSHFNNEEGFAAGLAQRFGSVLVNVNIARGESGSTAYVIGGSGRF